ncbi:MAG: alpha-L-fucosidase, partial [Lachnospiraceae bacterium]|nr:alpha-L-fucosidase [Lachnospiraceae bacterium]
QLGMFIHFGIYALNGISESWSFYHGGISYGDYMAQLNGFTASHFDADYWAKLFQESGARYSVLTSKHHDGVALFDTQYSDLSVVKKSPAGRDILKEYIEAVRKVGLHVGVYYSLLDWSHPDYASVYGGGNVPEDLSTVNGYSSPTDGKQDEEAWQRFLQFDRGQLKEILTNYGTIDLLWFDGDWERSADQWGLPEFKEYLLGFNPELIINSRFAGYGDYFTPEQGIPVKRPGGPWEFCTTINSSWGYQPRDNHYKSLGQIIHMFCDCIGMGGNLLLDIGPREDGTIDERQEAVLRGLGRWIRENEEAVYDTVAGVGPEFYGNGSVLSEDGTVLYLFVHDEPKEAICVKGLKNRVLEAQVLHSGKSLKWTVHGGAPWLDIPGTLWVFMDQSDCAQYTTVVRLKLDGPIRLYAGAGATVTDN